MSWWRGQPGLPSTYIGYTTFPHDGAAQRGAQSDADNAPRLCGQRGCRGLWVVVATIEQRAGRFVQHGSAPNWQGGLLTLATCKHYLRTFRAPEDWRGVWLAGFSGVAAGDGRNALVLLTRIEHAFASQADCWTAQELPAVARRAKAEHCHPFGDLFASVATAADPGDPATYRPPCPNHVHAPGDNWHHDIDYRGRSGRLATLLVGDPAQTFLWDKPLFYSFESLGRGQRKGTLDAFLKDLERGKANR